MRAPEPGRRGRPLGLGAHRHESRGDGLTRPFDAVLFDFTGVLTTSPFTNLAALEVEQGVAEGLLVELMLGDYGADGDHPWHELERGKLGIGDYFAGFTARLAEAAIELDAVTILRRFGALEVHEHVLDRIRSLRAEGYGTALVTNNVAEFRDGWSTLVPLDELFDEVVDSSAEGVRKPNPAIYLLALERLGVTDPSRAVFLDDHPGCVAGARDAGLHAIHVADPTAALAELDKLLVRGV